MPRFKFSEAANTDLTNIIDYTLDAWGVDQANCYIEGLDKLAQTLSEAPNLGKACEYLAAGLRVFPYQSHVLYYIEAANGITIVRVLHENMDSDGQFAQE